MFIESSYKLFLKFFYIILILMNVLNLYKVNIRQGCK